MAYPRDIHLFQQMLSESDLEGKKKPEMCFQMDLGWPFLVLPFTIH